MSAALELVRELAAGGREAGTDSARLAREQVAQFLAARGFRVEVERFAFSPSGLLGFPVFGAGLGWLALEVSCFRDPAFRPGPLSWSGFPVSSRSASSPWDWGSGGTG